MPTSSDPSIKTVSLILGSGGARGLAHIGIMRWLETHNYQIKSISGSSIGALIGGIYAAGKLDEFEFWLKGLSSTDILALMDIAWDRSGLIKGEKLNHVLKKLIGNPNIEDLAIPYTAVATDIHNEKEVWLQTGSLLDAMRASYSLPMIFTPHAYQGLTLIDGGVLNPVPIAPTFGDHNALTIAVNLGAKPHINADKPLPVIEMEEESWLADFNELVDKIKDYFVKQENRFEQPFNWDVYDISNKAFDSMQSSIARQQLAAYPPDITIDIPRDACGMLEFTLVNEMITLGYQTAEHTLNNSSGQPT